MLTPISQGQGGKDGGGLLCDGSKDKETKASLRSCLNILAVDMCFNLPLFLMFLGKTICWCMERFRADDPRLLETFSVSQFL